MQGNVDRNSGSIRILEKWEQVMLSNDDKKTHNDWHINHYYKDFFVTIFQKMEKFWLKKKNGYFDVMPYAMKVYMHF